MMDDKAAAPFLCGEVGFMSEGVSGFFSPVGGGELLSVGGGDGLDSRGGGELSYLLRLSANTTATNFSFLWQCSSLPLMK